MLRSLEEFTDSNELSAYIRLILVESGLTQSLKQDNPELYTFFRALFQRHPDAERKRVAQIADIRICRFPKARRDLPLAAADHQIWTVFEDGTSDTISWLSCSRQEKTSQDICLTRSMRVAIEPQIREFRNASQQICVNCGSRDPLSVDHINHFMGLRLDFLGSTMLRRPTTFGKAAYGGECFHPDDATFEKAWQDYHRANAKLQILCIPCNEARPPYSMSSPLMS